MVVRVFVPLIPKSFSFAFSNDSLDRRVMRQSIALSCPIVPYRAVSSVTVDAHLCASDHLPVIMHAIPQRSTSVRSDGSSSLRVDVQENIAIITPLRNRDEVVIYGVLGNIVSHEIGTINVPLRAGVYLLGHLIRLKKFIVAF